MLNIDYSPLFAEYDAQGSDMPHDAMREVAIEQAGATGCFSFITDDGHKCTLCQDGRLRNPWQWSSIGYYPVVQLPDYDID